MTSAHIWPFRTIPLQRRGEEIAANWLSEKLTMAIREIVSAGGKLPHQSDPVILDYNSVRLIALIAIGNDGIGDGKILLRVTNELPLKSAHLRLAAIPYPYRLNDDFPLLVTPDFAGAYLDDLVAQIRNIPDLVPK